MKDFLKFISGVRIILLGMAVLLLLAGCSDRNDGGEESETEYSEDTHTESAAEAGRETAETDMESETGTEMHSENSWDSYVIEPDAREAFIDAYMGEGFHNKAPFYTYEKENDVFRMEFYYDERNEKACGICYFLLPEGKMDLIGFSFREFETDVWDYDKMSILTYDGSDGKDIGAEDLEEIKDYNESGELIFYELKGILPEHGQVSPGEPVTLIRIEYTYREDGTLSEKYYYSNPVIWGTSMTPSISEFDEKERIMRISSYLTHGSYEQFFIYKGEETAPAYCLELDVGLGMCVPRFVRYG